MKHHDSHITKKHRPKVHRRRWDRISGLEQRIFAGIRIHGETLDKLVELQESLPPIPMRRIPQNDVHLTLVPPWTEGDFEAAGKRLRDALARPFTFPLKFKYLEYGPTREHPFLIWVTCEASKELIELKKRLLVAFGKKDKEKIPFIPHVTIARLKGSFGDARKEHHVGKEVPIVMEVNAVELLASPHKGGVGYETLKKVHLHREEETPR